MRHSLYGAMASCIVALAGASASLLRRLSPATGQGLGVGGPSASPSTRPISALPGDANDRLLQTTSNNTAFSGGGLIGYNYQLSNNAVIGVEGDITTGQSTAKVTDCAVPDGCFVATHDLHHL